MEIGVIISSDSGQALQQVTIESFNQLPLPSGKTISIRCAGNKIDFKRLNSYLQSTQIHTLNLSANNLSDTDAKDLAQGMQGTQVHTLDLSNNNLSDAGAKDLALGLQGTQVHTLNLSQNNLGAAGAKDFAQGLQGTQVHTLDLSWNKLNETSAKDLAQGLQGTQVRTLDLNCNNISNTSAKDLAHGLQGTQVHTLNLWWNNISDAGTKDFAQGLQGTQVYTLDLRYNNLSDAGAKDLALGLHGTQVHTLYLYDNALSTKRVNDLAKYLRGSNVTKVPGVSSPELEAVLKENLIRKKMEIITVALATILRKINPDVLASIFEFLPLTTPLNKDKPYETDAMRTAGSVLQLKEELISRKGWRETGQVLAGNKHSRSLEAQALRILFWSSKQQATTLSNALIVRPGATP